MWFPDKKLNIAPAKYKTSAKVIWTNRKAGTEHAATVLESFFKSLNSGYSYLLKLDEPVDGNDRIMANESNIHAAPKPEKKVKEPSEKKPRTRKSKKAAATDSEVKEVEA